ncbi:MAG: hypothetical protein EXQ96_07230 [Alphaproteobacteria bacterium]|nr:hypothetical protein [Alphaproteobacteria bacterium]
MRPSLGWERVRLHDVAADLGLSLAELRLHFRELDAIGTAWLARADAAMLAAPADRAFRSLPARERISVALQRWLDALAGHRRVTGQVLRAKLYPGHPQHTLGLVWWVSRTVQWLREAVALDAGGRQRQVEEIGLTALFLATLWRWVRDESPDQERTRRYLANRLALADRLMAGLFARRHSSASKKPG